MADDTPGLEVGEAFWEPEPRPDTPALATPRRAPRPRPPAVPVASVVLWVPEGGGQSRAWKYVVSGPIVLGALFLMALGLEEELRPVAMVLAALAVAVAVVVVVRRHRRSALCTPSHMTVGDGYLELRTGSGTEAEARRWPLSELRSITFRGASFGEGGDVLVSAADGEWRVMTGPPVDRTKRSLKRVRAAVRSQGYPLGRAGAAVAAPEAGETGDLG